MTKQLLVFCAHWDDAELTMWPYINYIAAGYDVRIIGMSPGAVTAASLRLDPDPTHYAAGVQPVCTWADHAYKHNPTQEQYTLPTTEEIGLARIAEGKSAAGAMGMIPPTDPASPGFVYTHAESLGTNWGSGGSGSSTAPVVPEGIDAAEEIIRNYMAAYPGSVVWGHSPTDAHCDHRAVGLALRRLKGVPTYMGATATPRFTFTGGDPVLAPALVNAQFWVSKLYWSTPAGEYGSRIGEYCSWYPNTYPDNTKILPRREEYTAWIKTKVLKAYTAWCPAAGQFAIGGGHSVPAQFADCFGAPPPFVASALWHP